MTVTTRWKFREVDFLAVASIVAIVLLGSMVRRALSPDGVAYLDLADALRHRNIDQFVQGYWSPLYPILLAIVGAITGQSGRDLVGTAHLINVLAVIGTIAAIWWWARQIATPWFGRAVFAALFTCSAAPPRVETLTPDLLLVCVTTGIAIELIHYGGRRWIWLGLICGVAYFTKTSTWPWLVLMILARVALAGDKETRVRAAKTGLVAIAFAMLWIAPMSYASGRATVGVTARLNYRWYIEASDARTPDTHRGDHRQYQDFPLTDSLSARVVSLDTTLVWTYQPWSDPDGWSYGIRTHQARTPTFGEWMSYWLDTTWQALSVWLSLLLLTVIVPAAWIGRRRQAWRELLVAPRGHLVAMLLGLAGIAQYLAVHAEPRLIAPFVLLFSLAVLDWLLVPRGESIPATVDRMVLSLVGLVAAMWLTMRRVEGAAADDRRIAAGVDQLARVNAAAFAQPGAVAGFGGLAATAPTHPRVAVIGPVMPVLANIFWTGGRVVAQVPPASVPALRNLPTARRSVVLHELFADRADVLWITGADGSYNIVRVP